MPRHRPLPHELSEFPFSVRRARLMGISKRRLDGADLERPFAGVRGRRADSQTVEERCLFYSPRLALGQFFSHTTAARLWHLPLPRRFDEHEALHVSTPKRDSRVRTVGVVAHRLHPPHHRVHRLGGLYVSDAVSTWLQLASILGVDDLVAVGDALVLVPVYFDRHSPAPRPYATPDELRQRVGAFRGPGKRRLLEALELIRMGCESPKETALRLLLVRSGLPEPQLNLPIRGTRSPFVPRVDLVYAEWKVLVEYDGEQHRTDSERFARDRQRGHDLRAAGFTLVTVVKSGLAGAGRMRTVQEVREALLAAGWQG